MADGTAQKCGRVGSCHIYSKNPFYLIVKRVFLWAKLSMQYSPDHDNILYNLYSYHQHLYFPVCKNIQFPSCMIIIFAHEDFNGLPR